MSIQRSVSRRAFLKDSVAVTVGASLLGGGSAAATAAERPVSRPGSAGVAMVSRRSQGRFQVDLVSLETGEVLDTKHDFQVSRAVVTAAEPNRFFLHGVDLRTGRDAVMAVERDPDVESWRALGVEALGEGPALLGLDRDGVFVWSGDGVRAVDLGPSSRLAALPPVGGGQRCWFCWTPQGLRYRHDTVGEGRGIDGFLDADAAFSRHRRVAFVAAA